MADASSDSNRKRPEAPPIEFLKPGETQAPPPQQQAPVAWVTRPEDYQQPAYPVAPAPPRQVRSGRYGMVAGILMFLAAGLGIAASVIGAVSPVSYATYLNYTQSPSFAVLQICGLVSIMAQGAALLGGVMAIQRLNWKLTMVCAILATLTIGFAFEASAIGLAACVVVLMARREFPN